MWYVAAQPDESFSREHLQNLLWDESPQQIARQNFNTMFFRFQKELPVPCFIATRAGLRWNPDAGVTVDVETFQQLTAPLATLRRSCPPRPALEMSRGERDDLARAVDLYTGPFLDGFSCDSEAYEQWLSSMRRKWENQIASLLDLLLAVEEHHNQWDRVIQVSRRGIEIDPLEETYHRAAIKALAKQGRHAAAFAQYQTCRDLLQQHLGVEPDASTTALYESIAAQQGGMPVVVETGIADGQSGSQVARGQTGPSSSQIQATSLPDSQATAADAVALEVTATGAARFYVPSTQLRSTERLEMTESLHIEYPGDLRSFSPGMRKLIAQVSQATVAEARSHVPELPAKLMLVFYTGTNVIAELGVGAAAIAPGVVACTVDPSHPAGMAQIVSNELRPTLLHELHHLARGYVMYGGEPAETFMDYVVSEGLATAFERDLTGRPVPWAEYPRGPGNDDTEVRRWVEEMLTLPLDAPYRDWMFLHPDGRRWIGYRAGTYLADQAMAALGRSAGALARIKTAEVLQLAGFDTRR